MSNRQLKHTASRSSELIAARREDVLASYNAAAATNRRLFLEGSYKAAKEYILPNQMEDANNIVEMFYKQKLLRAITVQKRTKVGADGLMIQLATLMTTHNDDELILREIRIITGMSNKAWETDMIEKAPMCFKCNIFHHAKFMLPKRRFGKNEQKRNS